MGVTVALVALLLAVQSSYVIAFSTKEGASAATLVAVAVALAPLAILLAVYLAVRRRRAGRWILPLCGAGLLGVMELLLPVSPFKTTLVTSRQKRALEAVQILDVRDEPFLSPAGNPVGIRVSFEAYFPRGGRLSVSPSLYAEDERFHHYQISMGHFAGLAVDPEPGRADSGTYTFAAGERYRFTADFLPIFIFLSARGHRGFEAGGLCLWERDSPDLSTGAFRAFLREPRETRYRVDVRVDGNSYFVPPRWAFGGITSGSYSVKTFYESALREKAPPCPW